MKKTTLMKQVIILLGVFAIALISPAQTVQFDDSWSGQGFNLTDAEHKGVTVVHSVNNFRFNEGGDAGKGMSVITMPGVMLPNEAGAPDLPGSARYIALPEGATARLNVTAMRVESYKGVDIAPAPVIPFDNDDSPLVYEKNMEIYGNDTFYPENPVRLSDQKTLRGVNVVLLGITPFQYNPVTRELRVLRDIEVEVEFVGGNGQFGDQRYRSRWWDPILADAVLNFGSLPQVDYNSIQQSGTDGGDAAEYLIITADDPAYVSWADSIKLFRNKQGILTEIRTLTEVGGNNTATIEAFIDNAYNTWTVPPAAVLLIGDFGTDIDYNLMAPIYNSYCASDNIYADVDGDHMPEMAFGRITANDSAQVAVMVSKFLNYEANPPTNPDFYDNPITAIGWQTSRWFQICGETVGGYWVNEQGKSTVRINEIYSGSPGSIWSTATNTSTVVDYFGPNGLGYIPAEPGPMGGWNGGSATMINNTINNGSFIMLHRDHGSTNGWGEPDYNSSNINSLENTDLIYVMSINCLTGKYNMSGECFAEKFHRHTYNGANSGALGITAASETSYSFVNDTYVWGFIDNLWPDFMPDYGTSYPQDFVLPAFGNASGKIFLQQSSWPYNTSNKEVTYNLFHHHGGAFLNVYSEIPQPLNIVHDGEIIYGSSTFEMSADSGALICLYYNGAILSTATATGAVQSIPITTIPLGEMVTLTVTKQNFFRSEELLEVVDPLTAGFTADLTTNCTGGTINYTDLSVGDPVSWAWTFEGGTPSTSTDQHPQGIAYNTPGDYDVTLIVTASTGIDTLTNVDYISIFDNIEVSATISASATEVCEGDTVTFTLSVTNGGTSPVYQWKVNGNNVGNGSDTYVTSTLADEDIVECEVTSSFSCATQNPVMSNAINMTVNTVAPAVVNVVCDTARICLGTQVIFDAIIENGGDDPHFQWFVNGDSCGTDDPYYVTSQLEHGDTVSCSLTSNAICLTENPVMSNKVGMTVISDPDTLQKPDGPTYIDLLSSISSQYTTNLDTNITIYNWMVDPEEAYTNMDITMNEMDISWSTSYMGEVNIKVYGENDCATGAESDSLVVTLDNTTFIGEEQSDISLDIYPNPGKGVFNISITTVQSTDLTVSIRNSIGEVILTEEYMNVDGKLSSQFDLSTYSEGIYFVIFRYEDKTITRKIIFNR